MKRNLKNGVVIVFTILFTAALVCCNGKKAGEKKQQESANAKDSVTEQSSNPLDQKSKTVNGAAAVVSTLNDHKITKTEYEFYQTSFWGSAARAKTTTYTKVRLKSIIDKIGFFVYIKFQPNANKDMTREAALDLSAAANYTNKHVTKESPYPVAMFRSIYDNMIEPLEVTKGTKLIKKDTNGDGVIDAKDAVEVGNLVMFKMQTIKEVIYYDVSEDPNFTN